MWLINCTSGYPLEAHNGMHVWQFPGAIQLCQSENSRTLSKCLLYSGTHNFQCLKYLVLLNLVCNRKRPHYSGIESTGLGLMHLELSMALAFVVHWSCQFTIYMHICESVHVLVCTVQPWLSELVRTTKKRSDNRGFRKLRLWIIKLIHENLIIHDNIERVITTCMSCSRISKQKKLVTWHCVSFVDRLIAVFCCNLWTSCRRTRSQSSCASSHRKLVDNAVCLAVEMHGRSISDAIVVFHIILTIW